MTPIDDDDEEALFVSFRSKVKLVRVVQNVLIPSRLKIRADVNPNDSASEDDLFNVMTKVNFWLDNVVSRSIAFASDNGDALAMLVNDEGRNRTQNVLMITPGEPTDDILAALFQAKFNAFGGDEVDFGMVEVQSDNPIGLGYTFIGDSTKLLPTMDRWMGLPNYFDKPWWARDDSSSLDVTPPEGADLTQKPKWAFSLDTARIEGHEAQAVKPSFKPTIIDGGKKEDE